MKVSNAKQVKSANKVGLLVERYNMTMFGNQAGEVIVRAATSAAGEWAEVHRFRGTLAEGVAFAKAATVEITGVRQAHVV